MPSRLFYSMNLKTDLSGKTALITGAAGNGLGRADALKLGLCGARIALIDINPCDDTLAVLSQNGIEAKSYVCDISDATQTDAVIKQILSDFSGVDILVNNASILTTVGMFAQIPVAQWDRDIRVNLIGSANVTRSLWPHFLEKKWGRVVFMASIAGTRGSSGQTSYAATKAGVIGLAKSLAIEGARFGITVNAIAPGVMDTEAVSFIRDDMKDRMKKAVPLRRFGRPEELAGTIAWLCSDEAAYVTGQVITVDGGSGLFVF